MYVIVVFLLAFSFCAACPQQTIAQDKSKTPESEQTLRVRLAKRSQEMIEAARFHVTIDGKAQQVPVQKTSLLRHTDAERKEQGGLWLIGGKGRPVALASIWTEPEATIWHCEVRSLSPNPGVGGTLMAGIPKWNSESPGVQFERMPQRQVDGKSKTLKPAKTSNLRFSQMKSQAKRFSGYEKWRGQRHELRVLPRELYRYKDPENGIVEGALFAIAHNTNTECYLMLELQDKGREQDWYYALGRCCYAEVHISVDKKEVWTVPQIGNGASAGPSDAYFTFPDVAKLPSLIRKPN